MDDNQVIDSDLDYNQDISLTEAAKGFLGETAKWAKFLSIIGFVMIGIMVLVGVFAGSIMGAALGASGEGLMGATEGIIGGTFMTIMYLAIGLLYLMPTLYLYRFASKTKAALRDQSSELLTGGFENLKSCFKFIGIMMVVVLSLYAFAILAMIIVGASAF